MSIKYNLDIYFESPKIKITYGHKFIEFIPINYNDDFGIYNYSNISEYRNIWNDVDLIYRKKEYSVKEIIKIHSPKAQHEFKFHLNTNLVIKKVNNNFILVDPKSNRPYFKFDDFILFDKDSKVVDQDIQVSIEGKEVTIKINKLDSSLYPLQIDPSIVFIPIDSAPTKKAGGSNSIDLDIIHRSDYGTVHHEKQHGQEYDGDPVSFSRKVDLRLNLEGPVAARSSLFETNDYNIKTIQSDVAKHKYIKLDPLSEEITESLYGETSKDFGFLTVSPRKLNSTVKSTTVTLNINNIDNIPDINNIILDWNVFIIDRHTKKQIFTNAQIENVKYKDSNFGSCIFGENNKQIKYTISNTIPFSYIVVFSLDIYHTEKKSKNLKASITNFAKVFGEDFIGLPSSVYFTLEPDLVQITESNKKNTFNIEVSIPKSSITYIGNNEFEWKIKKFNAGKTEILIDTDQYDINTDYGTISIDSTTRTLHYIPPDDISILKQTIYIEASTTFFDPFLYEDRTIYATSIITSADFKIVPSSLRPTICSQDEESFRIHNFGVRAISDSTLQIPNNTQNNFKWELYVDDVNGDSDSNTFLTWVVNDPDSGRTEISDTQLNGSILDIWRYYGGISSHFHINNIIENVGYTLGDRDSVINYVESGNKMPEQLFLTYTYLEENQEITLLSIISPSSVIPEDCADESFSITLDPHCIISSSTKKTEVNVIFSSDINALFKSEPENFIMNWTATKVNPDLDTTEELILENVIELTNNIKRIRVLSIDSTVLPSTGDFIIISGYLTYLKTNQVATDYSFVYKNADGITIPTSLEVPIKSGKRFDVEFSSSASRIENNLTYNYNEEIRSSRRKIKAEVLSPIDGSIACTIDDVINGTRQENIALYGKLFIDYQFPLFNESINMPDYSHSYRLNDKGITYTAPLSKSSSRQFVIIRLGFKNPVSSYAFDYVYSCVELTNPVHKNIYPDILKSRISGVEQKETNGNPYEYFKDLLVEPDRAYEFYVSNDVNDDDGTDKYVETNNYELKIYGLSPVQDSFGNNTLSMIQYHRYTTDSDGIVSNISKDGFLHAFGIRYGDIETRSYEINGEQNFNIQFPNNENAFSSIQLKTFYDDLFDSNTGKFYENVILFIEIIGERSDGTLIQNSKYTIKYIPTLSEDYAVYKNMRNGYLKPTTATYSTFLIDPFPTNLPSLSRYYASGEKYYLILLSTNNDLITYSSSTEENIGRYFDNTPNDTFSKYKLDGKTNYSLELKKNTDVEITKLDGTSKTVRYESRFAFRGNDDLGTISIIGGFEHSGTLEDLISKFQSNFSDYTNSRLENRLLNNITQKIELFTDDPEGTPTDSVSLQLLVFEWEAPTFETEDDRVELDLTSLSGIKSSNSGTETISNGSSNITLNGYFESKAIILGSPDSKPLAEDQIFEGSMYYNKWNGDIYIGLSGNGMKYVNSNNLQEYSIPDVESFGVTYDPDLEDNILDRFTFPEYRHMNDEIVNYDFTKLGQGGRIGTSGIDFPETVTCFYMYFDYTNIKYILFFGTEDEGLWCFDDVDIYGKDRTLQINGLAKKIFSPSLFLNTTSTVSDTITDIKMLYPTLDIVFSTKDTVFLIPAEKISSRILNPDSVTSIQDQTFQSTSCTYIKASKFDVHETGTSDFQSLGSDSFGILNIPHLRPYAVPVFSNEENEHSGNITIVNTEEAQSIGFQMILVTDNYSDAGVDFGDLIWIMSINMNIDTTRSLINVNEDDSGNSIVNTFATTVGQRLALDSNGDAIHIPRIDTTYDISYRTMDGWKAQENIENNIRLGSNFISLPGESSRFLMGSMHRQQILNTWGSGLDEEPIGSIVDEFGYEALDSDGITYNAIDRDELSEGNAYLNPIIGYIPKNTRPSALGSDTPNPGNFILSSEDAGYSSHLSHNDHSLNINSSGGIDIFVPYEKTSDLTDYDYDIYWRLYYNLIVKRSTSDLETHYDSLMSGSLSGYSNFSFTDDPGSEYTLIQVPRVDSISGNSLWTYANDEDLTIKLLIQSLNNEIDNGKILYFKTESYIISYKLSSKTFSDNSTIKSINLVDGEFLASLPKTLSNASTDQLVWVGGGTANTIKNYIDNSGRDFVLIHHTSKRHIYNSQPETQSTDPTEIHAAEQRTHYNGYRANPYTHKDIQTLIYEIVPLHGNSDKVESERDTYVPGLTYYSGENNPSADSTLFRAYFEEINDIVSDPTSSSREKTSFIPGIYIPSQGDIGGLEVDDKGTIFFASNNKYHYLNALGSNKPIRLFNTAFPWSFSILNFHDQGTFKGRNYSDTNDLLSVTTSYNNPDEYLYSQFLDYGKLLNYKSSQKSPADSAFLYNPKDCSWFDYKSFWAHSLRRDFLLPNSAYIDYPINPTRNRRIRLTDPDGIPDNAYVTYHQRGATDSTLDDSKLWTDTRANWMFSWRPNWAYDGFWDIKTGGKALNIEFSNEAYPIFMKSPLPTIFAGDAKTREEETNIPFNLRYDLGEYFSFDEKNWIITHFAYGTKQSEIFYVIKNKNLDEERDYWYNKIHIYYLGENNIPGKELSKAGLDNVEFDFSDLFVYDNDGIGEIIDLKTYGDIICITYDDDVYAGIDPISSSTFSVSGNITLTNGADVETILLTYSGVSAPTSNNPISGTIAGNGTWSRQGFLTDSGDYTVTPILNGYTFTPSSITFSGANYTTKSFNFTGAFAGIGTGTTGTGTGTGTGTTSNQYSLHGKAELYDLENQEIATSPGVRIYLSNDNGASWYLPQGVGTTTYTGGFDLPTLTLGRTYLIKGTKPGFSESDPVTITGPDTKVVLKLNQIPTAEDLATTFNGIITVNMYTSYDPWKEVIRPSSTTTGTTTTDTGTTTTDTGTTTTDTGTTTTDTGTTTTDTGTTTTDTGTTVATQPPNGQEPLFDGFGILVARPSVEVIATIVSTGKEYGRLTLIGGDNNRTDGNSALTARTININDFPKSETLSVKVIATDKNTKISGSSTLIMSKDNKNVSFVAFGGKWALPGSTEAQASIASTTTTPQPTEYNGSVTVSFTTLSNRSANKETIIPPVVNLNINNGERTVALTGSNMSGTFTKAVEYFFKTPINNTISFTASGDENTTITSANTNGTISKDEPYAYIDATGGKYIDSSISSTEVVAEGTYYASISLYLTNIPNRNKVSETINPPSVKLIAKLSSGNQEQIITGNTKSGYVDTRIVKFTDIPANENVEIEIVPNNDYTTISGSSKFTASKKTYITTFRAEGGQYLDEIQPEEIPDPVIEDTGSIVSSTYSASYTIVLHSLPSRNSTKESIVAPKITILALRENGDTQENVFTGESTTNMTYMESIVFDNIPSTEEIKLSAIVTDNSVTVSEVPQTLSYFNRESIVIASGGQYLQMQAAKPQSTDYYDGIINVEFSPSLKSRISGIKEELIAPSITVIAHGLQNGSSEDRSIIFSGSTTSDSIKQVIQNTLSNLKPSQEVPITVSANNASTKIFVKTNSISKSNPNINIYVSGGEYAHTVEYYDQYNYDYKIIIRLKTNPVNDARSGNILIPPIIDLIIKDGNKIEKHTAIGNDLIHAAQGTTYKGRSSSPNARISVTAVPREGTSTTITYGNEFIITKAGNAKIIEANGGKYTKSSTYPTPTPIPVPIPDPNGGKIIYLGGYEGNYTTLDVQVPANDTIYLRVMSINENVNYLGSVQDIREIAGEFVFPGGAGGDRWKIIVRTTLLDWWKNLGLPTTTSKIKVFMSNKEIYTIVRSDFNNTKVFAVPPVGTAITPIPIPIPIPISSPPNKASNGRAQLIYNAAFVGTSTEVSTNLTWDVDSTATSHKLYIDGKEQTIRNPINGKGFYNKNEGSWAKVSPAVSRTWRVDTINSAGTTTGDTWTYIIDI